mmetsp:Transcript_6411/g.9612  ORF Transcript_6411/g.9612 Transcript_6411/m.9612 type:complete len:193 (+) Transcript_6411:95-673(+)
MNFQFIALVFVGLSRAFAFLNGADIFLSKRSILPRQSHGRKPLTCKWVDEVVSLDIPVSSEKAFGVYSNLSEHPRWSPWLCSVNYDRMNGTSTWGLKMLGFRISWEAVNTVVEPPREISWKSTTGLKNRGQVVFTEKGSERCLMTLTLSYDIPNAVARVLKIQAVQRLVKRTLLNDLERFREILKENAEKEH